MCQLLAVSDLASIESRVAGWLTGCQRINQLFAEGKDTYKDFATEVYHVSYEEVTKAQRNFSKPPVLGSVYGLGAGGLQAYADGYGVEMDEDESQRITDTYRATYPEIVDAWDWLVSSCMDVIQHRATEARGCGVRSYRDTNFLFIELPSGRCIHYYRPRVDMKVPPWEWKKVKERGAEIIEATKESVRTGVWFVPKPYIPKEIPNVTYMGMNQYTRKWERQSTHGGKMLENLCQAVARDVLAEAIVTCASMDGVMETILHVHDEVGATCDAQVATEILGGLNAVLSRPPHWADGLLLGAEGFITKRYKKD